MFFIEMVCVKLNWSFFESSSNLKMKIITIRSNVCRNFQSHFMQFNGHESLKGNARYELIDAINTHFRPVWSVYIVDLFKTKFESNFAYQFIEIHRYPRRKKPSYFSFILLINNASKMASRQRWKKSQKVAKKLIFDAKMLIPMYLQFLLISSI